MRNIKKENLLQYYYFSLQTLLDGLVQAMASNGCLLNFYAAVDWSRLWVNHSQYMRMGGGLRYISMVVQSDRREKGTVACVAPGWKESSCLSLLQI